MVYSVLDLRIIAKQLGIIRKLKQIKGKELAKDIGIPPIILQKFIKLAKSSDAKVERDFKDTIKILEEYVSKQKNMLKEDHTS